MSESNGINKLKDAYKYQELIISGTKYLIGVRKINDLRQVLITNLIEFYEVNLSKEDVEKQCKDLNPALIDCDCEEFVDELLIDIPKYIVTASVDSIELKNIIDDGFFWFNLNPTRCNPEKFYNNFMEIFYLTFFELHHRYNCLLDVVNKKDKEIAEYKAQGVQLLKKSLLTELFNEELFTNKLKNANTLDKINVYLNAVKFYNSMKDLEAKERCKKENIVLKSETPDEQLLPISSVSTNKRPSSDLRCAAPPKSGRKFKVRKPNPELQLL